MLITCGKCGKDISDKATKCPKCKTPARPMSISCPECGKDVSEADLRGDCPHCGYPLGYLRRAEAAAPAPQPTPAPAPKPPPPPKSFSLECTNCGCVLTSLSQAEKCPKCGFAMHQERHAGSEKAAPSYSPDKASVKPKSAKPKSRLRLIGEHLLIALLIFTLFASAALLMLRYDVFAMRSALRSVSTAEETEESIKGSLADVRLWVKHAVSVVLDQLPDSPASDAKGVESQNR